MDRSATLSDPHAPVCRRVCSPVDSVLVSVTFDDSWSTLDEEVALIDRLFGGEIAALFERHDGGGSNV